MAPLGVAAAQVPVRAGDLEANLSTHAAAVEAAARLGTSLVVFPELSLTGYDPDLAEDLAITPDDPRLEGLCGLVRDLGLRAVVGAPIRDGPGRPALGAIVIGEDVRTYRKMHLGWTEPDHFAPGTEPMLLSVGGVGVGLAICADTSRPDHPGGYARAGASVYAAGVFLTEEWYATDTPRYPRYARELRLLCVMANQGETDGRLRSVGRSAIWAPGGEVLTRATATEPTLLVARMEGDGWQGETAPLD